MTAVAIPPETDPLLRYFAYRHLPAGLMQETSRAFATLAEGLVESLPRTAERTVALRKLLESKDAAVRSALDWAGPARPSEPSEPVTVGCPECEFALTIDRLGIIAHNAGGAHIFRPAVVTE